MATSKVYLTTSQTGTLTNDPTVLGNLQMFCNKYELTGPRQSTTLLPQRIQEHNGLLSGGDKESQLNKPVKISEKEIIDVIREAAPNVADGYSSSLMSNSKKNKNQLSMGHIPQYAKCFTCQRIIKEDHFSEHLLFGPAKCLSCRACYNDCQSFQLCSAERSFARVSCSHEDNFCYYNDPVKYLIENFSKSENIEIDKIPSKIKDFIRKCTSLSDKLPWKQGIDACKAYLGYENMQSSILSEGKPRKPNSDVFGIAKRKKVNVLSHFEDDAYGVILSQDYNLKELEEATEFVEIRENTFHEETSNEKEKKKQENKRKKKPIQDSDTSCDESLEYLPIPSNGFYYVSTKSIEKCPNCNEVLCPSNFVVNVTTFLITTVCTDCKLTIYITSPEVQILTKDNKKTLPTNSTLDVNKKKRGRPRKHE